MIAPVPSACSRHLPADLQATFLSLLPRVEMHGRVYFRHLKCAESKREAIAEMVALCWQWFVLLTDRGKDVTAFASALASYAARAVKSGRRLCGQEKSRDALSPLAQSRHGFVVSSLPDGSSLHGNVFDEALRDNTQTPPEDQAAFRIDFPAWLATQGERRRSVAELLMLGECTGAAARHFGVSPARVSQLRREFQQDWRRFCADPAEADRAVGTAS